MKNRIELKSIKYASFASEETHCYEGKLYFDGVHCANVWNDGHGGCDGVQLIGDGTAWDKLVRYVNTLPKKDIGLPELVAQSVESVCCDLVNQYLYARDLRRTMSKRVVYTVKGDDRIYQSKAAKNARQRDQWVPQVQNWNDTDQVLNSMPFDQALELFMERA